MRRVLRVAVGVIGGALTIVGLAGVPDDVQNWAGLFASLDGDLARLLIVTAGVMLAVGAQFGPRLKTTSGAWWERRPVSHEWKVRAEKAERAAEERARELARRASQERELEIARAKLTLIDERERFAMELMHHVARVNEAMHPHPFRRGLPIFGLTEEQARAEQEQYERYVAEQVQVASIRTQDALDQAAVLLRDKGRRFGVEQLADELAVIDRHNPPTQPALLHEQARKAARALTELQQRLRDRTTPSEADAVHFLRECEP